MKKIVIITGLTASGKSGLAVEIAKKYNGEIISADSVQIYRGLDIGSAKESAETMSVISHHLIDIKNPDETYNVGEFIEDCKSAIEDIISRNKLPIIVGGTGLYVKALLEGYSLGSTADNELREKYQKLAENNGNEYVWNILNEINPNKAKTVHFNNLKRVIRYIEIELNGEEKKNTKSILEDYDVLSIGVIADRDVIYNKINERVDIMIADGLEQEITSLKNQGITRENQSVTSIGYREWFDYFEGKITKQETIDLIKQHTRNYCKRQLTFLKTINDIELLDKAQAKIRIEEFLND